MPTPDARPVGETALARDRLLHLLATHLVAGQEMTEHDRRLCDAALVAYRDAVAAEARAALLASGTPLWVATNDELEDHPKWGRHASFAYRYEPDNMPGEIGVRGIVFYAPGIAGTLRLDAQPVPPGTKARATLIVLEAPRPARRSLIPDRTPDAVSDRAREALGNPKTGHTP